MKRSAKRVKRGRRSNTVRSRMDFRFLVFICVALAGTGIFILVQHQYAIVNEMREDRLEREIEKERARQEDLRIKLAKLKSPARVSRIAQDELGMIEPGGVIHLKYTKGPEGRFACQSSYQKRVERPPVPDIEEGAAALIGPEPEEVITSR